MAFAADQAILGSQLLVKNPSTADKRSFVGKAKELSSPNPLVGNPVASGATLTVRADGDTPSEQTFLLTQGAGLNGRPFWSGNATSGFKYRDPKGEQGPVKFVQIKKTGSGVFLIKTKGSAKFSPLSIVPPNLGTGGCILLELGGGDSYSVAFPTGTITNSGSRVFKVKRPPSEATCVVPIPTTSTSTTTTSTTEPTTSTTESTTSTTESTTSTTESTTSSSSTSTSSSSTSSSTSSSSTSTSTSSTTTSTLGGPTLPPNVDGTGTITFGVSGASAGDIDGQSVTFTCVDTTWTKLYWGSSSGALPAAGLDGFLHTMTFTTFSSTVMWWAGTTDWKDPNTGIVHTGVPTLMTATITAGGLSFVSPPTGAPGGIGATVKVVDPAGSCSTFTVKVEFFADIPTDGSAFIPLNTVPGPGLRSSFSGAFYWVPG